jgi:hypothetical protein
LLAAIGFSEPRTAPTAGVSCVLVLAEADHAALPTSDMEVRRPPRRLLCTCGTPLRGGAGATAASATTRSDPRQKISWEIQGPPAELLEYRPSSDRCVLREGGRGDLVPSFGEELRGLATRQAAICFGNHFTFQVVAGQRRHAWAIMGHRGIVKKGAEKTWRADFRGAIPPPFSAGCTD